MTPSIDSLIGCIERLESLFNNRPKPIRGDALVIPGQKNWAEAFAAIESLLDYDYEGVEKQNECESIESLK